MARGSGLTAALRHRDFRLLMGAYTAASIGGWAYQVGLAVWIYEQTGSAAWLGVATVFRFVPALVFSPYGGVLADRMERVWLMVRLDVVAALMMAVLAVMIAVDVPVIVAILTTALSATIGTMYDPAAAALTPQLVPERDLGAANALRNTVDNLAVIAGPALGALVLLLGPPQVSVVLSATTYAISAVFVAQIRTRSTPVDVTEGGSLGVGRQMLVGITAIGRSVTTAVLVAYSVAATFVYGFDTVQFVLLSRDVLGTGAEGYGSLLAGLGLGGILAAPLVVRLERLPSLGVVILAGMATYCLPTLLFLVVSEPVAAFFIQVVRGGGTLVVDVLAITALQRALPNDILARVFGAFDTLVLAALIAGAVVAPAVIDGWGLTASLWIAGVAFPILSLAGLPALRLMDREATERQAELAPRKALLEQCDLFSHVSDGGLEQLAGSAATVEVPAGTAVLTEGEPAADFYVLEEGVLAVTSRGERAALSQVNSLEPPDYFGEIGLIEQIPRTATVTAARDARLLRIPGEDFLAALTEYTPSTALVEGAAMRLGRTHPSLRLTQQATGTTTDS